MRNEQRDGESVFDYDVAADESLSQGVVRAVSTVSNVDPIPDAGAGSEESLDPLYTVVDPDALDAMFRATDSSACAGQITFTYHGREVTVHSGGRISVRRLERATGEAAD